MVEVGTQAVARKADAGAQPSWNPFGDDNFSKLTAEELLNKDFAKLDGKLNRVLIYWGRWMKRKGTRRSGCPCVCLSVCVSTAKPPEKSSTENLVSGVQPAVPNKGFPQCTGIYPDPYTTSSPSFFL